MRLAIQWIGAVLLLVGFSQAHATKARLQALGQGSYGSLFIKDQRNIFLNPATISSFGNSLNLEAGPTAYSNTTTPKSEGGIIYQGEGLAFGAQLGRLNTAAETMTNVTSPTNYFDPQNSLELMVGGQAGIDWGGALYYASSVNDQSSSGNLAPNTKNEAKVVTARGGVATDRFQAYAIMDVIHDSKVRDNTPVVDRKYDGNLSVELGGSLNLNDMASVGGKVSQSGYNFDDGAGTQGEYKDLSFLGEYFYRFKNEENFFVFGSAGLLWDKAKTDYTGATTDVDAETLALPAKLGFESTLTGWLKFRGSVTQNMILDRSKTKNATQDVKTESIEDTTVTLGTSLYFENFTLDATLEGSGSAGSGKVNGNTLMANAGVLYSF
ncbi:MAG: hypothetical protein KDD22_09145 [Bdellovibrionales bacterium]|nr:hypothetical protein [Bdellovibrionales bacterium]